MKLWQEIHQFEQNLLERMKKKENLSTLSDLSESLWQSFSGRSVTSCTRTAATLVQYFQTRRDKGTKEDLAFHNGRFLKARNKCLTKLKLAAKKYPAPKLSLSP